MVAFLALVFLSFVLGLVLSCLFLQFFLIYCCIYCPISWMLKSDFTFLEGKLERTSVLKAICSGFKETSDPLICLSGG